MVDDGEFFELKAKFARNLVTGFGRLDGHPVGFVANQPMFLAGSLDVDASDKAARFIRFCDAFNIPVITLMDVPGFFPGKQQEEKGIIRNKKEERQRKKHGLRVMHGPTGFPPPGGPKSPRERTKNEQLP